MTGIFLRSGTIDAVFYRPMEKFTLGILADLFVQNRFSVEFVPHQDPRFSHVGNFFNLDGE
jgi:hypothetical protein